MSKLLLRLDNGLRVLLISASSASASLSLCVNVGSFSDPESHQGAAHLLEHVISVRLQKFVNYNFGSLHADTGYERTRFYLKLPRDSLVCGLDRLAEVFVDDSVVDKDTVLRELETVDNEYYLDSGSDRERIERLYFRVLPFKNADNPASKFSCGNSESLSSEDLVARVDAFRKKHYSANRMTLAVQANLPLETLEEYVRACKLSEMPVDWSSKPDDFSTFYVPRFIDFNNSKNIYKIRSYRGVYEMHFKWILPATRHLYKLKPMHYISQMFESEKKGSLSSYLRNKKLCYRLNVDLEEHSYFTIFSISFILLPGGITCWKDILDAVFSYVNVLRSEGPDLETFRRFRKLADHKFRVSSSKGINLHELSYHMHTYPPVDYLTGNFLYFEYDPEVIRALLDQLTPVNKNQFIVILQAPEIDESKEACESLPDEWIDRWRTIKPYPEFVADDCKNLFEFEENMKDPQVSSGPMTMLYESKELEVWYKSVATYKIYVYMNLETGSVVLYRHGISKPAAEVMMRLYELMINELLLDKLHDARIAGMSYKFDLGRDQNDGLTIKVGGFDHLNIQILLKILLEHAIKFCELVNADLFNLVKSELLKFYSSVTLEPGNFASEIQNSKLEKNYSSSIDKRDILQEIEFDKFLKFIKNLTSEIIGLRCFVQGGVDQNDALNLIRETVKSLNIKNSTRNGFCAGIGKKRRWKNLLPFGETCVRVKNLNTADRNSLLWNFYQTDDEQDKFDSPIFKEFFQVFLESRLFEELRIKDQIGYSVSFFPSSSGFVVSIYSAAFKFSTDELDLRVEKFMREFDDSLKLMTEDELSDLKRRFMNKKYVNDVNHDEEEDRNWFRIVKPSTFLPAASYDQDNHFFFKFSIRDIRHWFYHRFVSGGNRYRKLAIRVQGNADKILPL